MRCLLCFLLLSLLLLNCSSPGEEPKAVTLPKNSCDIPDSLFVLKNITNTDVEDKIYFDTSNSCYLDSTKAIRLKSISEIQKRQFIGSIPPYDIDWIIGDWQMYFVSKQDRVEKFTPIIISAGGTDFSAMILILLDSACHPKSHFILTGGECGDDPQECDYKHSIIEGSKIKSYVRSIVSNQELYGSEYFMIDSINYVTTILANGEFETKKIDSTRYRRTSFFK